MNTASKRFSAIHIALPFRGAGYLPDGSVDRQAVASVYEGIPASQPPVPAVTGGGVGTFRGFQTRGFQGNAFQSVSPGKVSRQRRKYPKRVTVKGRVYTVQTAAEEREILRALAEEAREQAKIIEALGDKETAKRAVKFSQSLDNRAELARQAEAQWLAKLLQDDEEILLIAA